MTRFAFRRWFGNTVYILLLVLAFGVSSYTWFKFFVRGKSIPTPNLIGRTIADARALSSDLGLIIVVDNSQDRHSEKVPLGTVVWQNREARSLIKRGTRLFVGQSLGPLVLRVPNLAGETPRTALLRFSQRNLKLGNLSYVETFSSPGIINEDPPRGTVVKGGTPVSLLVGFAAPPPPFVMPDLIDLPLAEVRPSLESKGLQVSNVKFESYPGIADGTIIRQYPLPGSPVSSRDAITLVVSQQEQLMFDQPPIGETPPEPVAETGTVTPP
jgi:beta-lactam-binding protein with PASTA domain